MAKPRVRKPNGDDPAVEALANMVGLDLSTVEGVSTGAVETSLVEQVNTVLEKMLGGTVGRKGPDSGPPITTQRTKGGRDGWKAIQAKINHLIKAADKLADNPGISAEDFRNSYSDLDAWKTSIRQAFKSPKTLAAHVAETMRLSKTQLTPDEVVGTIIKWGSQFEETDTGLVKKATAGLTKHPVGWSVARDDDVIPLRTTPEVRRAFASQDPQVYQKAALTTGTSEELQAAARHKAQTWNQRVAVTGQGQKWRDLPAHLKEEWLKLSPEKFSKVLEEELGPTPPPNPPGSASAKQARLKTLQTTQAKLASRVPLSPALPGRGALPTGPAVSQYQLVPVGGVEDIPLSPGPTVRAPLRPPGVSGKVSPEYPPLLMGQPGRYPLAEAPQHQLGPSLRPRVTHSQFSRKNPPPSGSGFHEIPPKVEGWSSPGPPRPDSGPIPGTMERIWKALPEPKPPTAPPPPPPPGFFGKLWNRVPQWSRPWLKGVGLGVGLPIAADIAANIAVDTAYGFGENIGLWGSQAQRNYREALRPLNPAERILRYQAKAGEKELIQDLLRLDPTFGQALIEESTAVRRLSTGKAMGDVDLGGPPNSRFEDPETTLREVYNTLGG